MSQLVALNYGQQFLFPPSLEDWVAADHPVRFLREFVEQCDLPALGFVTPAASQGRPPYAPSLLLKIWLYGYYFGLRSTRKLEAACRDHLPLLWLSGLHAPDHNSLWRFWRDHKEALRALFKETVQVALSAGCVGLALQALDGTRIQAAASGYSGWSKEQMEKLLAALDAALDETELKIVAENDELSAPALRPRGVQLEHEGHTFKRGMLAKRYRCRCRDCPVRAQCTDDRKGRQIEVWPHTATVQAMRTRLRQPATYQLWQRRREIIEPRFAQIKRMEASDAGRCGG
jgi:transposase